MIRRLGRSLLALALLGMPVAAAAQEDTTTVQADSVPAEPAGPGADTLYARAPVSPMGGLWRSILIPGWGQAKLNRKLTGALFIAWEGVTLGMAIKSNHELNYLRRTGSGSVRAKEKERQDWLVLLAFNHLFSAIEAYVSAHLWDFPDDLDVRAAPLPGGGIGAGVKIPF